MDNQKPSPIVFDVSQPVTQEETPTEQVQQEQIRSDQDLEKTQSSPLEEDTIIQDTQKQQPQEISDVQDDEPEEQTTNNTQQTSQNLQEELSIAIPAYFYPPTYWDQLEKVSIIIVNPNSGPGDLVDPNYLSIIETLRDKKLFGYVHTSYGNRPIQEAKEEIRRYEEFYGITHIFIDEVPDYWDTYYADLLGAISEKSIVNPGTITDEKYLEYADIVVIFEDDYNSYQDFSFPSWIHDYPAERFWHIVHTVNDVETVKAKAKQNNAGYVYITDDVMPNPYDTLPSYWNE